MSEEYDEDKEGIVEEAKERYEIARTAYNATRAQGVEDTKFYLGDSDNGWQWPQNIAIQRSTIERRPCLTINVTAQHVNQIVNSIRENRPTGKVLPVDDFADKKTAEIIEGLIRNIQTVSNADDIHDLAAEHAVVGGEGYWRIVTEYEAENSFNQVIAIKPILDPGMVYIDPFTREIDKSDAEWGFVFEDLTKEECKRNWPDIDVTSWTEDKQRGWVKEDTVRVADYYCCEYHDDILYQLQDGTAEYESRIPDPVLMQLKPMVEAGVLKTRPAKRKCWYIHKLVGNHEEPIETTEWIGSLLPIVQVLGKELIVNGEVIRKGLVRDIKDPARMVNYAYSATVETIALQNKVPYLAPAEAIEGYEQIWDMANIQNRAFLPYNHVDDAGNPIPMPQRQEPAVLPSAQIQLLQLSTDQMRAASGQQNANFGIRPEATSGIGIQRLKMQGEVATYHFIDNLNRALKYEIRVLLELITSGKIIDTKRVIRVLGLDGAEDQAILDPNHPQPYGEIGANDIQKIFNPTIGTYDVVIDTGPAYMTKRQEGAAQLTQIAQNNPQLMQVAGDLMFKALDIPYADKIAERLAKMLPPQLQEAKPGDIPPEVKNAIQMAQQHIQQQDQQIQQLMQELQSKEADIQLKAIQAHKAELDAKNAELKLQLDAYNAETARIKAHHESQPHDTSLEAQKVALEAQRLEFEKQKAQLDAETQILLKQMDLQAKTMVETPIQQVQEGMTTEDALTAALQGFQEALTKLGSPKKVVRGPDGRMVGLE